MAAVCLSQRLPAVRGLVPSSHPPSLNSSITHLYSFTWQRVRIQVVNNVQSNILK